MKSLWLILAACLCLGFCRPVQAATNDILSASIGADGWSAYITIEGKSTGGTYDFGLGTNYDPDTGTPKVVFTVVSKGFTTSGTATTITRTIRAGKQVRKPYDQQAFNDETTSGGNVTVRVALEDFIAQKDNAGAGNSGTAITCSILSGFYRQGGTDNNASGAGFPVTNNSTAAYQAPESTNWSMAPFQRVTGAFDLRAVSFHHGAKDGKPLAALKFSVTDGTTTVEQFATEMTKDADMAGDAIQSAEYVSTFNASSFIQGAVLTANFTAYPWVGDVTSTSSTGPAAPSPLPGPMPLLCDKTGAYGETYAVVDVTGGSDPAVGSDSGKWIGNGNDPGAGSGVTAYATIGRAARAIADYNNANRTPARNDVGGGLIFLKLGSYPWLGYSTTYGSVPATWVTIKPFPGVARSDVSISSLSGNTDISDRVKIEGVTITSATNNTFGGILAHWVHGCEINTTGTAIFNTAGGVGYFTQNKLTQLTQGLRPSGSATNWTPALVRGNTLEGFNRAILAYTVIGNKNMQKTTWLSTVLSCRIGTAQPKGPIIIYNNDLRGWKATSSTQMLVMGDKDESLSGIAVVQNLFESTTDATAGISTFAASEQITGNAPINNVIYWHNVMVGQRIQFGYNTSGGIAKDRKFWSVKNNYWDVSGYKTDTHNDPGQNGAHIGNWPVGFGVGHSGNASASVVPITGPFVRDFIGLSSIENASGLNTPASWAQFVNRQSHAGGGTETSGMGDYHLAETSPVRGLARDLLIPFDLAGEPRDATNNETGVYVYGEAGGGTNDFPVATITSPSNGTTQLSPFTFTGTATDTEDGTISASIVWTSSVDGTLGTGASISTGLSPGAHTITATVTDSDTNVDTDSISVTVTAPPAGGTINATRVNAGTVRIQ